MTSVPASEEAPTSQYAPVPDELISLLRGFAAAIAALVTGKVISQGMADSCLGSIACHIEEGFSTKNDLPSDPTYYALTEEGERAFEASGIEHPDEWDETPEGRAFGKRLHDWDLATRAKVFEAMGRPDIDSSEHGHEFYALYVSQLPAYTLVWETVHNCLDVWKAAIKGHGGLCSSEAA